MIRKDIVNPQMPAITQLHVYPVKSMRGISVDEAELTVRGLKYDRNWMVTDQTGRFITQRELPKLASVTVSISDGILQLSNASGSTISVSPGSQPRKEIVTEVWGDRCEALDEGDEISGWLTDSLGSLKGKSLRLVRFNDSFKRVVDPNYLKNEHSHTTFADGFPFLITSEESLAMLNDHLVQAGEYPVTMDRFRPNIVIKGLQPLRENEIDQMASADGSFVLGLRKPCKRCKVTTVDQESGEIHEPKEPLRTLTKMETVPGLHGAYFGQNATLLKGEGENVKIGDQLDVVRE